MGIVAYRKAEIRRPRPHLDQAQVVRAGLALLDEVGFDDLTMRRLAERLGVKAASLYRHVRNKEELLILLGDEISGEIPPLPAAGTWRSQLTEMACHVRRVLLAHRDAARVLVMTPPVGSRRLQQIEGLLRILRSAGLSPRDAARAAHHCNNFLMEFVADEGRFQSFAASQGTTVGKMLAQARKHFKSLPPDRFPTLVEMADVLTEDDPDGLFRFGLDVWLDAIAVLAARHRAPAPRPHRPPPA